MVDVVSRHSRRRVCIPSIWKRIRGLQAVVGERHAVLIPDGENGYSKECVEPVHGPQSAGLPGEAWHRSEHLARAAGRTVGACLHLICVPWCRVGVVARLMRGFGRGSRCSNVGVGGDKRGGCKLHR